MPVIQLDYIRKSLIIKEIERLFSSLTGLDLCIIDLENTSLFFPCPLKNRFNAPCKNHNAASCNKIDQDIFEESIHCKTAKSFKCPAGFLKIIVPIILKEDVLGIFFVGENESFKISHDRLDSVSRSLYQLVNYIIENECSSLKYFRGSSLTRQQEVLNRIIKYLQLNCHKNQISLRDVARDNGISYHYLSHLFTKELNTSFVKLRTDMKLNMAAKLLKDLKLTVSQVSYMCGFSDPAYFCKVFKTVHDSRPGDFRRKSANGAYSKKLQ